MKSPAWETQNSSREKVRSVKKMESTFMVTKNRVGYKKKQIPKKKKRATRKAVKIAPAGIVPEWN